jgi:magnesium chelatase subunit D
MNYVYPWSAVVGQDALKQALLLCAIDPDLGGVLVHGPRGTAKTTLARALGDILPGSFVELPLGASEDRVTGTLDLDVALREQRVAFSPGLLARAHQGVLYVDEVNLLPDPLVDLLLDAAASGKNIIERDGISHAHASRFVLIGTMNPEEGELRPQLVDRFGLSASVGSAFLPQERAEIVRRRLAFDRDPEAFCARFDNQQRALRERCDEARARVSTIALEGSGLNRVTELCHAAHVEGMRADLAMLRAARAHAALHGRTEITHADVEAVAELALAHRRREPPGTPPQQGPNGSSGDGGSRDRSASGSKAPASGTQSAAPSSEAVNESAGSNGDEGERGALAPVPVTTTRIAMLDRQLLKSLGTLPSSRRASRERRLNGTRGRQQAARGQEQANVDWFSTLARTPRPGFADLRYRARRSGPEQLWVVAVDCSSSMLRAGALSLAKGVAQALQEQASRMGARLVLLSFQGASVRSDVHSNAGRGVFMRAVAELGAGGGTPLRAALHEALALCKRPAFRAQGMTRRLFLLTDGRTQERVSDLQVAMRKLDVVVLDCERGNLRLGRAQGLAQQLSGRYLHVDALSKN